jgi:hypothetical protein
VITVTQPFSPTVIAHVDIDAAESSLAIDAGFAYAMSHSGRTLAVFDVRDHSGPRLRVS